MNVLYSLTLRSLISGGSVKFTTCCRSRSPWKNERKGKNSIITPEGQIIMRIINKMLSLTIENGSSIWFPNTWDLKEIKLCVNFDPDNSRALHNELNRVKPIQARKMYQLRTKLLVTAKWSLKTWIHHVSVTCLMCSNVCGWGGLTTTGLLPALIFVCCTVSV